MEYVELLEKAVEHLRQAKRVTIFTGAGVSAESGIPTFRDDGGMWQEFPPERFATYTGLMRAAITEPLRLARFIHALIQPIAKAQPNPAYQAIAKLEGRYDSLTVITQNIDGLHQEAGSVRVREVHGSLFKIVDKKGKFLRRVNKETLLKVTEDLEKVIEERRGVSRLMKAVRPIIQIGITKMERPSLVLFQEQLSEPDWSEAQKDAKDCDLMVIVGTSAQVQPAAAIPFDAHCQGTQLIEINPDQSEFPSLFLRGKAGEVLPGLVKQLMNG